MTEHVLVVDDSPQNRMVAVGHLEVAGYRVTSVASGEEALAALALERPDLVLLDVVMPGIGGYETCRRIRATPELADLPVLFLTALGDRGTTQPAIDAGADDLLAKPFNHAELLLRIRALIRLRKQQRQLAHQHEQLRRIGQMIVHDLRGPTGAILLNAELLVDDPDLTGVCREAAHDIAVAAQGLERTIRSLLDLSSAEDVGLEANLEELDVAALAADVVTALRAAGRAREIALAVDVGAGASSLVADRELVRRLLENLVHNALKHAPPRTEVRIAAHRDGDDTVLQVLDEGPGVPAGDRERIFDRYVSRGSYGLGLAFCRMVAQVHGGRIWVEGRTPTGAAFCVRIPPCEPGTRRRAG
ncbi:MAG: hybrid sensor histidine kinase/response regulator [Deltaproteobacteria bacterium]|nr:hybrid sensor histidine kinase/response regulator [Deltaproteobacteria bacterium]